MKKYFFAAFILFFIFTVSFLFLPRLFVFNALMFFVSTLAIGFIGIWVSNKAFAAKKSTQNAQVIIAFFLSAVASIAIFFAEYPFWIMVPEGFCNSYRYKSRACHFESEITNNNSETFLPIYVVGHSWHTGLMLRTKDIPKEQFPDLNLSEGLALEIGWGSESFYRATDYTFRLGFDSFFFSNPSVLHVVTLPKDADMNFPHSDIYVYWASRAEYQRMLRFVADTFMKDEKGRLIDLGPGIYGHSRFYRGLNPYHFPKSCNSWTANAIYQAGAPIWPNLSLTARNTLHQVRLVGEEIRRTDGFKVFPN